MRKLASIFFLFILVGVSGSASLADKMSQARRATVSVLAKKSKKPFQTKAGTVFGTGFVIHPEGYIVTSAHNLTGQGAPSVKVWNQKEQKATVVAQDVFTDLAVLKIEAQKPLPYLEWDARPVTLGQKIFIIGTPFGLEGTVSAGIVSEPNRLLSNQDIGLNTAHQISGFIQTDAAMSLGHSGGPMLSERGKVVGVNAAIVSPTEGSAGLGFAIPASLARFIVEQLIETHQIRRLSLGVELQSLSPELGDYFGLEEPKGALISGIDELGQGYLGGLRSGDLILSINGTEVLSADVIPELLTVNALKEVLRFQVKRNGEMISVKIKVTPELFEAKKQNAAVQVDTPTPDPLQIEEITALDRLKLAIPETVQGGIVRAVPPAFEKQIFLNSVLEKVEGKSYDTAQALTAALKEKTQEGTPVLLHFWFQGKRYFASYS